MKLNELFSVRRAKAAERDKSYDPALSLYLVTLDRGTGSPYAKVRKTLDGLGTRIDAVHQASFLLSTKRARDIQAAIVAIPFGPKTSIARIFVGKIQAGWSFKIPGSTPRKALQNALRKVGLKYN